jgi:hypothetical protein
VNNKYLLATPLRRSGCGAVASIGVRASGSAWARIRGAGSGRALTGTRQGAGGMRVVLGGGSQGLRVRLPGLGAQVLHSHTTGYTARILSSRTTRGRTRIQRNRTTYIA